MYATRALTAQNIEFLRRGRELIQDLTDELYREAAPPLGKSGVGCHFRHCLDFYSCFAEGLPQGRIDYDLRNRDSEVEISRSNALKTIDSIIEVLESLGDAKAEQPLEVSIDCPGQAAGGPFWSRSTLLRELQMLSGHTVHHYALIAMLLRARGFDPGTAFGVAPSTLTFEKLSASCPG